MDLNTRCSTYEAIEQYRGRPLIVYATSTRSGAEYQISEDAEAFAKPQRFSRNIALEHPWCIF